MRTDNDAFNRRLDSNCEEIEVREPSPLQVDVSLLKPEKAKFYIVQILQHLDFAADIITDLAASAEGTEFVVRMPKLIQEGLDSGAYKLMTKQTGEICAEVLQKSATSNRMVVKQKLEIVERAKDTAINTNNLTADLANIAIQQQMAEISAQLDEVISLARSIEQGQQNDRFALIDAAEESLRLAAVTEDEANRLSHIHKAQHDLVLGANQIAREISKQLQSAEGVPESDAAITVKMFFTRGNYFDKMNKWFDGVQESFEILEKAYGLLALCAIATDEPGSIDALLEGFASKIEGMDTKKLLSMRNLHPEVDFSHEWFANPMSYISTRKEDAKLIADGGYIDVTVTGHALMEAIKDETE